MEEAASFNIGWQLQPIIRGFTEPHFRKEVESFVSNNASEFAVVCHDGSYPHSWSILHKQYMEIFERQLTSIVQEEGFSREDFFAHVAELRESASGLQSESYLPGCEASFLPPSQGITVTEFWDFLKVITASQDFDRFLKVMFEASVSLTRGQSANEAALSLVQEIEIIIPEGHAEGEPLVVEYLGTRYELEVPEGYRPGMAFRTAVYVSSPTN